AGSPSPTSSPRALGAAPSVLGDRDELVERGRELLLARPLEPLAQDRDELRLRPPVDEDDEAEAELLLVGAVELVELGHDIGSLLGGGACGQLCRGDRRGGGGAPPSSPLPGACPAPPPPPPRAAPRAAPAAHPRAR